MSKYQSLSDDDAVLAFLHDNGAAIEGKGVAHGLTWPKARANRTLHSLLRRGLVVYVPDRVPRWQLPVEKKEDKDVPPNLVRTEEQLIAMFHELHVRYVKLLKQHTDLQNQLAVPK